MGGRTQVGGPSAEEARAIREAIAKATTLEEVGRLDQMLKAGMVPGKQQASKNDSNGNISLQVYFNQYSFGYIWEIKAEPEGILVKWWRA